MPVVVSHRLSPRNTLYTLPPDRMTWWQQGVTI